MAKKPKFDVWFESQFGKRRESCLYFGYEKVSDNQLQDKIEEGKRAARVLLDRDKWDEKYKAARYAISFCKENKNA